MTKNMDSYQICLRSAHWLVDDCTNDRDGKTSFRKLHFWAHNFVQKSKKYKV